MHACSDLMAEGCGLPPQPQSVGEVFDPGLTYLLDAKTATWYVHLLLGASIRVQLGLV